jgi:catechol 2,3-dioxygenase-like lactoylglutathione lyase family enzyme
MHHAGIVLSDLAETQSFYRDTLGFPVAAEFTLYVHTTVSSRNAIDVVNRRASSRHRSFRAASRSWI